MLGEGVGAVIQHALGECMGLSEGLDPKVAEHGVGFPAAHKLDSVFVNTCTEKGGGTARAKAASAEKGRVDTREGLEVRSGVADAIGDEGRLDHGSGVVGVDGVDRSGRRSVVLQEVKDNPTEAFARADVGVVGGTMANLFPANSILLVIESECSGGDLGYIIQVMQRCCRGVV